MVRPPMMPGRRGRDHAAEHEEQHHAHQRDGRDLGALLVVADGAGQLGGQRLQAGQLDVDAVVA